MAAMLGSAGPKIHDAVVARVRALELPRGAAVLDIPCGAGEVAIGLAKQGYTVHAGDLGSELIAEAAACVGDRFRVVDMNGTLPWPDSSFDLIVSVEGVEHLENVFAFFREAYRVCRPGGLFLITTPNVASLRSRIRYFGSSFFTQDPRPLNESARHPLHHIGLRTFSEWRYMLHVCGFQLTVVSHTHIKPVSYLYAIFAPWTWLYTRLAFRKEKDPLQRASNRDILRALSSPSLLFGQNLLLVARKIER
jgi:SAM-dependent methyltransferase